MSHLVPFVPSTRLSQPWCVYVLRVLRPNIPGKSVYMYQSREAVHMHIVNVA